MANILIVDADHTLQMLFTIRLQRQGHDVLFAVDGQEGLNLASKIQPDLLIIDSDIPVISGHDMLSQIRQTAWGKQVPVIMVTASSLTYSYTSMEDSADLTLYKPVSTIELITIVKRLLHTTTGETVRI